MFGRIGRHLLDVHPAGRRSNEGHLAQFAIYQHAEIKLAGNVRTFLDINDVHRQAFRARLVRNELPAEHISGVLPDLFDRPAQLHAARFAPPTGMHLSFDDPKIATEFAGRILRFLR